MIISKTTRKMIYGIGIDIIKTKRMKEAVEKWGEKFVKRVFTENEIAYCYERRNPFLSLSVRFAAKEALIKAIGSELPVSFTDIEVINTDSGKPVINIRGKLQDFFNSEGIRRAHLSLSHEHDYGIACVILEH